MRIIKTLVITIVCGAITLLYAQTRVDELVKLKGSGVDDEVLIAYIQNSTKWPALNADEIVGLKDAGISNAVIAEALRHARNAQVAAAATPNAAVVTTAPASEPPAQETVDRTVFEEALNPYGTWVLIDGVHYWRPGIAAGNPGWAPYMTNGHWVYTDLGWTWVSDYPWGWAPFHYGRWIRHSVYGWVWWPDVTWGPAWVRWRTGDDYCGWAPLPPFSVFVPNHGFFFRGRFVNDEFDFGLALNDFFFVPSSHFCDRDVWARRVDIQHRNLAYKNTVFIRNNFTFSNGRIVNHGPSRDFVARVTRTEIRPMAVESRDVGRPGPNFRGVTVSKGKMVVERPRVTVSVPLTPSPERRAVDRSHDGRAAVVEPRASVQPNNPEKSSLQKQSVQRSEDVRPAVRQDEKKNGPREQRDRGRRGRDEDR
jgi:hypothetical protein